MGVERSVLVKMDTWGVVALRVAVCIVVVRRFVGEPLYAYNLKNDQ